MAPRNRHHNHPKAPVNATEEKAVDPVAYTAPVEIPFVDGVTKVDGVESGGIGVTVGNLEGVERVTFIANTEAPPAEVPVVTVTETASPVTIGVDFGGEAGDKTTVAIVDAAGAVVAGAVVTTVSKPVEVPAVTPAAPAVAEKVADVLAFSHKAQVWVKKVVESYLGEKLTTEVAGVTVAALVAGYQPCIVRNGKLFGVKVYELPFDPLSPASDAPSNELVLNIARRLTGAGLYPKRG